MHTSFNYFVYTIMETVAGYSIMPAKRNSWNAEKARIVEKMYESDEKTSKIASIVGMSVRSVQQYINNHISDAKGDPWRPFEGRKKRKTSKREARSEALLAIVNADCTLTKQQMLDRLPNELKCSKRVVSAALKDLGYTWKRLLKKTRSKGNPATCTDHPQN